jgi:6-phosphogluconolactonase (cycloisomerase 2 family)
MKILLIPAVAAFTLFVPVAVQGAADDELADVQDVAPPSLQGVTSVTITKDGKFVYTAAYQAGAISIFERNAESGKLTPRDGLLGPECASAICIRLSHDENTAAVAHLFANRLTLFKRDPATGGLTKLSAVEESKDEPRGLQTAVDTEFSGDDHFLYVASAEGLGVFKIEDNQLTFVQHETGDDKLHGVRGCALSPDGRWVYAAAGDPGVLAVFSRDAATGKLTSVQMLKDGDGEIASLAGAFRVAPSADGRQLYVSSGRFHGDQAVSVFEVQPDGSLKVLQQFINGKDDFTEFEGGNSLQVSPDGKAVVALSSVSDRLFRFTRDPATGKLTYVTSQQAGTFGEPGAAGLCFSADGKFLYVADENEGALQVYKLP